jgi:phosphate butyryltransferase
MAPLQSLEAIVAAVQQRGALARVVVAGAEDPSAAAAVARAAQLGIAVPVLVGDAARIHPLLAQWPQLQHVAVLHEPDPSAAVARAIGCIQEDRAEFLMKGAVKTDVLLRAVLDRKAGLGVVGVLSHVAVLEHPLEPRLLLLTDAAVNVAPSLHRKIDIIANAVAVAQMLGIARPRVAVLSATERIAYQIMPSTKDADVLAKLCRMGVFGDAVVGGPYALDITVSRDKARHKGVGDDVAGQADILCAPDIEAGNILYKSISTLMGRPMAGVVVGACRPLVVPSRADEEASKLYALALAAYLSSPYSQRGHAEGLSPDHGAVQC